MRFFFGKVLLTEGVEVRLLASVTKSDVFHVEPVVELEDAYELLPLFEIFLQGQVVDGVEVVFLGFNERIIIMADVESRERSNPVPNAEDLPTPLETLAFIIASAVL